MDAEKTLGELKMQVHKNPNIRANECKDCKFNMVRDFCTLKWSDWKDNKCLNKEINIEKKGAK